MPTIKIKFPNPINVSVQKGDTAYYTANTNTLGTHLHSNYGDIIEIGEIIKVNRVGNWIKCDWNPNPANAAYPTGGDFIMFSKDNRVNLSSLIGYYAEVKFVNNSVDEAELFSVGVDMFASSK